MNYLNRPVFTWPIDWSSAINRSISYDLRETALGFGAEFFVATQTDTAQGWEFSIQLATDTDIAAVDNFTAALYGRLNGFWLPVPFEAFRIVAGRSAAQFDIAACGLTATWQDRPDIQLWFGNPDGTGPQCAGVTAVADNGDGTERVTIGTVLNPAPSSALVVRRLHYVRLMEDVEKGTFEAESWLDRPFSVIELPSEYANVETGRQPIYLYHFSAAAPILLDWYYTSFAAPVWSNGIEYLAFAMNHGAVNQTARGDKDELQIEARPDTSHPLSLFFPAPFPGTLNVVLLQCALATPDNTTQIFSGVVRNVDDQGSKHVAHCSSLSYLLDRKVSRLLVQPNCNYTLFDVNCGKRRMDYEVTVIITQIINHPAEGPSVVVQLAYADLNPERTSAANWFAQGIFETGFGTGFEPRTILGSSWDAGAHRLTLDLNLPLWQAQVGQYCQITAGCDGKAATCGTAKFNNYPRFGGHPAVPQRNLSLEAFNNLPVAQGGKK